MDAIIIQIRDRKNGKKSRALTIYDAEVDEWYHRILVMAERLIEMQEGDSFKQEVFK